MQAANGEERVLGQRTWDPKGQSLERTPHLHAYIQIYFQARKWTKEIAKPQVSTKFEKYTNWVPKKLQPEMEICYRK